MKIEIAVAASKTTDKTHKMLVKARDQALAKAGIPLHAYVNTKSGVSVDLLTTAGQAFDHSVPLAKRGPDKKAPMYYSLTFNLLVGGKTHRITSDGPIDNSDSVTSYVHRFPSPPTAAEVKAVLPEFQKRLNAAADEYRSLIKKYNKIKK